MASEYQYGHTESSVGCHDDAGKPGLHCFNSLAPAPRQMPGRIGLRLMLTGFINHRTFGFAFGAMAIFVGLGFVIVGNPDTESFNNQYPSVIGWLLLSFGVCVDGAMAYLLLADTRRLVRVFAWGEPVVGSIDQIYATGLGKYQPYAQVLGEMAKHEKAIARMGLWSNFLKNSFKNWRVKFQLTDSQGHNQVIDGRMNLSSRAVNGITDPRVILLVDYRRGVPACIALEQFSWVGISHTGQLVLHSADRTSQSSKRHLFVQALQVVVPTYCLSALGLVFGKPLFTSPDHSGISLFFGAVMVGVFTFTHGVTPMFVYRLFVDGLNLFGNTRESTSDNQLRSEPLARLLSGFSYLHMIVWYGLPIIVLAALTGWLNLAWALVHLLLAGRGRRWWLLLQHGSTSTALVLFILFFSGRHLFPLGVLVIFFQSLLLTVVEWKGKQLWIR